MVSLAMVAAVAGCAPHYPADPYDTLTQVTDGALRVGASHNEPFVSWAGSAPSGREVELVERYAETLNAEVEWTRGGEEDLVARLERGELDMIVGGLTNKTPWKKKVGLTRPYAQTIDQFGQKEKHVLAVRKGENAFLLELDTFLQTQEPQR